MKDENAVPITNFDGKSWGFLSVDSEPYIVRPNDRELCRTPSRQA